ncbi:hypothetical protein BDQ17DRAFT_1352946 [Cyathus striatus]|nr:hypothetical protein BDQ17DRAFT_1352946 [Cyathus striatus]
MPATYTSRTYSKRSHLKRKITPEKRLSSDEEDPTPHSETGRKRRKVSVDNDLPLSTVPTRFTTPNLENNSEGGSPSHMKPSVKVTYGTPRKHSSRQRSATPELMSPSPAVVTPKKQARDLSQIFASVTPSASPNTISRKSTMKLAKRMLSRSKTEPANEDSSAIPVVPTPVLVSSKNTTRTYAGTSRSFLVSMPVSSLSLPTTTSVNESQSPSQTMLDDDDDDFLTRESYSSLRARWGVDNSEDDPYPVSTSPSPKGKGKERLRPPPVPLPNGMMNPLKSITELRSKGESRRFLDEVGYLFEGMARSGAIGLRRASAQEITTKLCDPDFARKARAADFLGRTWDVFIEAGAGRGEDKLLDILLAFLAALVARQSSSLAELAQRASSPSPSPSVETHSPFTKNRRGGKEKASDVQTQSPPLSLVDTLFTLLDSFRISDPLILVTPGTDLGDADLRKAGIGKKDKVTLAAIYSLIASKSNIFVEDTPISTTLLLVYALQSLPPSLLHKSHLTSLLTSLRTAISSSSSVNKNPASLASSLYLIWKDASSRVPYENIHFHLRLLDTYLLKQWDDEHSLTESQSQGQEDGINSSELDYEAQIKQELDKAREEWLVRELVALGICAELKIQAAGGDTDAGCESAGKCLEFALRVLVSLTHSDEKWGKKVLENEYAIGWVMRIITAAAGMSGREKVIKEEHDVKLKKEDRDDEDEKLHEAHNERGEEYIQTLDRLCLALGLLTNLVQAVSGCTDTLRETRMDPTCILRKRACVRSCTCSNPINLIDILGRLYRLQVSSGSPSPPIKAEPVVSEYASPQPEISPGEVDAAYLRGHLSILFGLLMRSSKQNQVAVLSALPRLLDDITPNSRQIRETEDRAKLNMLIDQARDFVGMYAVLSANSKMRRANTAKWQSKSLSFWKTCARNKFGTRSAAAASSSASPCSSAVSSTVFSRAGR